MKKIRVLVIDDSAYNRRTISKMLEGLPEVEVVGYAADGEEGIRSILTLKPDLVTLDIEMPRMDGFTLLRIIMSRCPTPVIVVSAQGGDDRVFKALELGALDFIAKPTTGVSSELLRIRESLLEKVRSVCKLNMAGIKMRESLLMVGGAQKMVKKAPLVLAPAEGNSFPVVAIGASTGGPPALQSILSAFPEQPPFAVLISQHMPQGFTRTFAERLNRLSAFEVKEAADGDRLRPGRVFVAPGGRDIIVQSIADEAFVKTVAPIPSDSFVPSVNRMFISCAGAFGSRLLAVVLTGMGNDGCHGVKAVKAAGGQVVAESESSAVIFGMPREAIATGAVDKVVPLDQMAGEIMVRCGNACDQKR